jgi:hypothetical protein
MPRAPVKLYYEKDYTRLNSFPINSPQLILLKGDCFAAAKCFGFSNSIIHNFANNEHQGGPSSTFSKSGKLIDNAGVTQEDQIVQFYHQNLILPESMYPICSREDGEAIIVSQFYQLPSLITCPAVIGYTGKKWQKEAMIKRIKLMLVAAAKMDKVFITGLWGCGVFGCEPKDLLSLWNTVLQDKTVAKPKQIVFAILAKEKENFELFKNLSMN